MTFLTLSVVSGQNNATFRNYTCPLIQGVNGSESYLREELGRFFLFRLYLKMKSNEFFKYLWILGPETLDSI